MEKEVHLGRKINILDKRIHRAIDKEASKYGITGVQGRILGFITHNSKNRDIFQKDIEEELDIRRSSVTSVLQLMEKNGFIERVSVSEDARLKKLIITEKGAKIQKSIYNFISNFEKSFSDELSEAEMNMFISLLDRLSNKISE
ncbi:MarR family winged helix-turn-helix transcriptional regulator [Clostridium saccharoperbutylacetonicum]|uniref:MarR family winged helix-turn-helix transcriptional regulator n=1 Tax=Clostridium saccharoperbutylacetonicum TaxID=36745 RepID=UPI0039E99514